jgi:hypothetical protein
MAKAKSPKRIKPARIRKTKKVTKPAEETHTATNSVTAVAQQQAPPVESHQAAPTVATPPTPVTEPGNPTVTWSEAAKANIKEGLRLHQIAGRPTKALLIGVFGKAGYLLTWPKRIEKFGITPETFQAALAKGVPAVPLAPVAKPNVEKTKGKA